MNSCDYDVAIVGAGFSGLAAALFLGNANRRVLLFDSGQSPRNASAQKMYNLVGYGKKAPGRIIAKTNEQIRAFQHVERCHLAIDTVVKREESDDFLMSLSDNNERVIKRIILAMGVTDLLPNIKGIEPFWPHNIFHCPYCIAYELKNQPLAIYSPNDEAYMMAKIIHKWTDDLIVFTEGKANLSVEQQQELDELNIKINRQSIISVVGEPGQFITLNLDSDQEIQRRGLFIHLEFELNGQELIGSLGVDVAEEGIITVDSSYQTSVAGVYAVGDISHLFQKVSHALQSANMAAFHLDHELAMMPYY
ncbi:NAD(P)/FAD-dependent oxidoreductase [Piscirickettsia litoralis]|uniref:Pyridine nucleotide-disulfide oxidoreductase n=1 Tax=Piscirickettsia litoralis TaxID=1891921 RepID=A0ABX3A071_9GAMM|nr:NAD(P)/FAD-dependent oxidoreductase [Piscirickettsia litoralis]ODN42227.1 pyridine nucleotide-disulfide oxidoreductase [Piscirickettsia litoralis]